MTKASAIIVCDHGLGHLRRCALLALKRRSDGERVTLFAPHAAWNKIKISMPIVKDLYVYNFETQTSVCRIRQGLAKAIEWLDRLPALGQFDDVICDNLPEILDVRHDAIISAQFFWHEAIEPAPEQYATYCRTLLSRFRPEIQGCDLFSMPSIRQEPGYKPVGLYCNPELQALSIRKRVDDERRALLISGGSTRILRERMTSIVNLITKRGPDPYQIVYVDPELLPSNAPNWLKPADFSAEMYSQIDMALVRPGLGVLTDLLTVGAKIIPLHESDNLEMQHNAKVINAIQSPRIINNQDASTQEVIDILTLHEQK